MAPILGYWNISALAQPIRLLLTYTGTEFEDKRYNFGPAPDYFEKSDWLPEKFSLGLDFPNLPYYIDGDLKITQTTAIMRYLGRKHDLYGQTERERVLVDVLDGQLQDVLKQWFKFVFDTVNDQTKAAYAKAFANRMKPFSEYLGTKSWLTGEKITFIDIWLYDVLDTHMHLDKTCIDEFQNLLDFHKRFEELPAIKRYLASPQYIRVPLTGPFANYTGV